MTGRRQHFLPRFLQRPFCYRRTGSEEYVHVFRKDRTYAANLMGVGQERDFYGDPAVSQLDATITAGESQLASILSTFNEGSIGEVDGKDAALLVSALSIRTKAMREAMSGLMPAMLATLRAYLGNEIKLRDELRSQLADDKHLDSLIAEQLGGQAIGRSQREQFARLLKGQVRQEVARQETALIAHAKAEAIRLIDSIENQAGSVADEAYLRALSNDPHTPKRADQLAGFCFEVIDVEPSDFLVLGDCGVVAIFSDGRARLALGSLSEDVRVEQVILPLSPRRMLVGSRSKGKGPPAAGEVNRCSAALSTEFFVSDRSDPAAMAPLQALINTMAPIDTVEDLVAMVVD